jgi:hypothetical protein
MIQMRHELTEVIGVDAGWMQAVMSIGGWWLVVERRKCEVNQPVTCVNGTAEDLGPVS